MHFETVPQVIDQLDQTKFEPITTYYQHLRRVNGRIDEQFHLYFPHLMICKYDRDPQISPKILTTGSLSSQRELFGDAWANTISKTETSPDPLLEIAATNGYQQAATDGHSCDLCEFYIHLPTGPKLCTYMRYISVIETHKSIKFFSVAGVLLDRNLQ